MRGKKKVPLESTLQSKVSNYIKSNYPHSVSFKIESASVNGVPDVFFSIPGYGAFMIEFKRDVTQNPRANQVAMIARLNRADCPAYVVHTFDEWMDISRSIDSVIISNKM